MTWPAGHIHCSEREGDGSWEDCLWCALVEALHDAGLLSADRVTHSYAEALRAASGEPSTGGSNFDDARLGVRRLLGFELPPTTFGAAAIWTALVPGTVAVINGARSAWPVNDYDWRRWDRGFTAPGYHSGLVARPNAGDPWWCDPLAPNGIGYLGERMPLADLLAFLRGYPDGGSALIWPLAITEEPMAGIVIHQVGSLDGVDIGVGPGVGAFRVNEQGQPEYVSRPGRYSGVLVGAASGLYAEVLYGISIDGELYYVKSAEVTRYDPLAVTAPAVPEPAPADCSALFNEALRLAETTIAAIPRR